MAWTERTADRTRRGRVYADGAKRRVYATLAALHYDDAGAMAPVDMTPQRVEVPALDGWRIVTNGWHYALGQPGES